MLRFASIVNKCKYVLKTSLKRFRPTIQERFRQHTRMQLVLRYTFAGALTEVRAKQTVAAFVHKFLLSHTVTTMLNYTRAMLVSIQVKWRQHHRSQTSRVSTLRDVLWEKIL